MASSRLARLIGVTLLLLATATPAPAGFFDMLFGGDDSGRRDPAPAVTRQQPPTDGFPGADQPATNQPTTTADSGGTRSNFTHCVRMCDGKHFPLLNRGGNSPVAMCQAFCPASESKVFFGSNIERAISMDGERYSETRNAFAYKKALSADCTCNGRDPVGLAPVDLSMDATLRPGDIVATGTGFVAYSAPRGGARTGGGDFTPVASYSGMSAEARARLSDMKVAPVKAGIETDYTMSIDGMRSMDEQRPRATLN